MEQSILTSTKKVLGIGPDDTSFDLDILIHINSAFSNLSQLGIGPEEGFVIEDATPVWDDLLVTTDPILSQLKTYIYLRVRMLFDPPTTPYFMSAMEKQIVEHEVRLSMLREAISWVLPEEDEIVDGTEEGQPVIDGGEEGYA